MNNTITEMKNTLEGINSRITEAEEQISELEGRVMEISAMEQNKEKRMKRNVDSIRELWETLNIPTLEFQGPWKEKKKRKGWRKYLKRLQSKTSLKRKGNSYTSPGNVESPIQDKPKEEQAKIHINQNNKIKYKLKY